MWRDTVWSITHGAYIERHVPIVTGNHSNGRITIATGALHPPLQTALQPAPDQRAQPGLMGDPWQSAAPAGPEQGAAAGVPGMAGGEDYIWTTLIPQQQAAAVMRQHLELAQHQSIVNPVSI